MEGKTVIVLADSLVSLPTPFDCTRTVISWPLQHFCIESIFEDLVCMCHCAFASTAPQNDLQLLREFESYEETNDAVAKAATTPFSGHLVLFE